MAFLQLYPNAIFPNERLESEIKILLRENNFMDEEKLKMTGTKIQIPVRLTVTHNHDDNHANQYADRCACV